MKMTSLLCLGRKKNEETTSNFFIPIYVRMLIPLVTRITNDLYFN